MTDLWERDAWDLADSIRRGEISSSAVVEESLARIAAHNGALNAVCHLDADGARARAAEIDAAVTRGEDPGAFAGVPIGVKELAQAKGFPDTHASVVYRDDIAPADCPEDKVALIILSANCMIWPDAILTTAPARNGTMQTPYPIMVCSSSRVASNTSVNWKGTPPTVASFKAAAFLMAMIMER